MSGSGESLHRRSEGGLHHDPADVIRLALTRLQEQLAGEICGLSSSRTCSKREVEHYPGGRTGGCPDLLGLLVDRGPGRMCVSGSSERHPGSVVDAPLGAHGPVQQSVEVVEHTTGHAAGARCTGAWIFR